MKLARLRRNADLLCAKSQPYCRAVVPKGSTVQYILFSNLFCIISGECSELFLSSDFYEYLEPLDE